MDPFDFDGAADGGCWMSHDDGDDYGACCLTCGEPCHPSKMSNHTPDVCRSCCPVIASDTEAERLCEMLADGETEG